MAILAYNCVEYLEASYAAFKLRGTPVNLNYRYRDDELTEVLEDSDAEVLVFHGSLGDLVGRVAPQVRGLRALVQIDDGSPLVDGALRYDDLLNENVPLPRIERSGDDVFMLYTGGTTGKPRGVLWRHRDIISTIAYPAYTLAGLDTPADAAEAARAARTMHESGIAPVVLPAPPMIHGTAFYMCQGAWLLGGRVVILEGRRLDGTRSGVSSNRRRSARSSSWATLSHGPWSTHSPRPSGTVLPTTSPACGGSTAPGCCGRKPGNSPWPTGAK